MCLILAANVVASQADGDNEQIAISLQLSVVSSSVLIYSCFLPKVFTVKVVCDERRSNNTAEYFFQRRFFRKHTGPPHGRAQPPPGDRQPHKHRTDSRQGTPCKNQPCTPTQAQDEQSRSEADSNSRVGGISEPERIAELKGPTMVPW